ncbi:MAG: hypothetical protein ABR985_18065 [Methanotrichaceae archaeon]|jgi:hypothetical protein
MTIFSDFYRLDLYEEARGPLEALQDEDGFLVAKIGKVRIIIPQTFEQNLRPLVGRRISCLKTDLPQKSYLFRDLDSETPRKV